MSNNDYNCSLVFVKYLVSSLYSSFVAVLPSWASDDDDNINYKKKFIISGVYFLKPVYYPADHKLDTSMEPL